jgi:hypothetical protein
MVRGLIRGALAGAAGATALNAVTCLDMVWRGRPGSDSPQRTVEALADRAGTEIPGEGESRANRLSGLGALSGIATGIGVGALYAVLRRLGFRPGPLTGSVLIGLTAMAATDLPMARLDITDPAKWSRADWLSDLLPHLAYGAATQAVLRGLDRSAGQLGP